MRIAFIGLGIMGSRMAANLLTGEHQLTVWNRSKEAVETLVAQGAKAADTPAEAVAEAEVVLSMLSTPEVVEQLALGETGWLQAMQPGTIWADCSTVNPSFSLQCLGASKAQGVHFLDTPVAGTKPHAQNAELVFFVGGNAEQVELLQPLFDLMGRKTMHVGDHGKGTSFKMLVNAMLAESMLVFSETMLLGEKMGLDRDFLLNALPNLVVAAPFTKAKAEMIRKNNYEVMFPLEWMHKDLQLVAQTAYELRHPLPMANLTKEIFAGAANSDLARQDFAAIHAWLER